MNHQSSERWFSHTQKQEDNMLTCILLFMVGLKLEMGTAYFVVLAIAAILCCIKFGMNIADKLSD